MEALKKNNLKRKLNEKMSKLDINMTRISKIIIDDLQGKKKIK